ncbi:MAG TPA: hypothetical protein VFE24_13120 [Pirellulales bacterium]|jgi:hypothetical protein|nr:hypothetical protein [Pirellulales bacterium]
MKYLFFSVAPWAAGLLALISFGPVQAAGILQGPPFPRPPATAPPADANGAADIRGPAPASPEYVTLKSVDQGVRHDVQATTYAYGWFGAAPHAGGTRFQCSDWIWHKGSTNDCWLWWYR